PGYDQTYNDLTLVDAFVAKFELTPTPNPQILPAPTSTPTPTLAVSPTVTSTPVPPGPCSPRPSVAVQVVPLDGGRLQVTIGATSTAATPGNRLVQLRATIPDNARVDMLDGPGDIAGEQLLPIGDGSYPVTFRVRRIAPGAITIPLVAVDRCGEWPSF